jgi:hypothetical protein
MKKGSAMTSIKGAGYSSAEVQILVEADQNKPLSSDELFVLASIKTTFGAQVTGSGPVKQLLAGEQPEPENVRSVKRCVVCNAEYYVWSESEYCSNKCAKQHDTSKNPSKPRIRHLRQCIRSAGEMRCRETGSESLDRWLRNFEARIEWMREQAKPNNQGNHENANDISER